MEAVEKAKNTGKRKFAQSIDLVVNLQDVDLKKTEARISELVELPNAVDKDVKICVIGSGQLASEAKKIEAVRVLEKEELETIGRNRKAARKIAHEYDFFISEAALMSLVGKTLGSFLGPKGKMPTPVPPNAPINQIIERQRKLVRLKLKDQPVIQCGVGSENMKTNQVVENIQAVLRKLEEKLERGPRNISKLFIKTTMGKPVPIQFSVGKRARH